MILRKAGLIVVTATVVGSLAIAGCGKPAAPPKAQEPPKQQAADPNQPAKGGTYVELAISDPRNLNPILSADTASSEVIHLVFDQLMDYDDKAEYVPRLAQSFKWSADKKSLTLTLRKDVKWHDGKPFTARDVVFTANAIMHPGYTGFNQSTFEPLAGAEDYLKKVSELNQQLADKKIDQAAFDKQADELFQTWVKAGSVSAPDDATVVFKLGKVWAPFEVEVVGIQPVPEHLLKDALGAKMKDHEFNRKPVGTGRYKFVDWKAKEAVTLAANKEWFGGEPNISQIIIKTVPDSNTLEVTMETGNADYGSISSFDRVEQLKANKNLVVNSFPSWSYDYVGWNLKNPLFQDKEVRQALAMAVDRETAVKTLLLGNGEVAHTHGAPTRWDYSGDVPVFKYDKAKAEQILDAKGWKKGPDGIRAKDGKKFSFTLITNAGNKRRESMALVIQQNLKEVGIEVKTDFIDFTKMLERIQNKAGQFDAHLIGWQLTPSPHSDTLFKTGASQNDIFYSNPKVDELFEKAGQATDRAEAKKLYGEIAKLVAEDQPYMFLLFRNKVDLFSTKVKGPVTKSPLTAGHLWNVEKWWIAPQATAN